MDVPQILVVDDNPTLRLMTTRVLSKAGYSVMEAATGEQALYLAREHKPNLILLDVVLKGEDGCHLCRQLKADPALENRLVVLVSAIRTCSNDQADGLEMGADGYIARPIANRELLARVGTFVRLQQALVERDEALAASHEAQEKLESQVQARTANLEAANQQLEAEITARKATELALRETQKNLRALLDAAQDSAFLVQSNGTILECNKGAAQGLGIPREAILGANALDMADQQLDPQVARQRRDTFARAVESAAAIRYEDTIGNHIFDTTIYPILDSEGQVQRLAVFAHDITVQKETKTALQSSERKLRQVLDLVPYPIFAKDEDGRFLLVNEASAAFSGRSVQEMEGRLESEWATEPSVLQSLQEDCRVIETQKTHSIPQAVVVNADGETFTMQRSKVPFEYAQDKWGVLGIAVDVSELTQFQERLRRYAARLEILHEIEQRTLSAESPQAIAETAACRICSLTACQQAAVTLLDRDEDQALILAVTPSTTTSAAAALTVPLEAYRDELQSLGSEGILFWDDLPSQGELGHILSDQGLYTYIVLPIQGEQEILGALSMGYGEPQQFHEADLESFREVANALSIALQQAQLRQTNQEHTERLEERVAHRTRELQALYQITAVASKPLDVRRALEQVLEHVLDAVGADAGAIYLKQEESGALDLVTERAMPSHVKEMIQQGDDQDKGAHHVFASGQALYRDLEHTMAHQGSGASRSQPSAYANLTLVAGGEVAGVLGLVRMAGKAPFSAGERDLLAAIADQIGAVIENAHLRQQAQQLAVFEERQRLARELHDSVTQSLYSTTLLAETGRLAARAQDIQTTGEVLSRVGEVTLQALKEMRLLIYELRPPVLEREGLVGALQARLDTVESRSGVRARLLVNGEVVLPPPAEEALYRIGLEALNNALKHAKASTVTIRVRHTSAETTLEITDDGQGFDLVQAKASGGMGLSTMKERAAQVGGTLSIVPVRGAGTTIVARIVRSPI